MEKILLTGITGLVGSAFAADLLRSNPEVEIYALVRRQERQNSHQRVAEILGEQYVFDGVPQFATKVMDRIKIIEGDVSNPEIIDLKSISGISKIFHCAADVNLGKDANGKTFDINFNGTANMIKLAEKHNVDCFHYVSTAYVAGTTKGRVMEDELPAVDFHNSYEKSKFEAETLVRKSGIPFTIYRPSIIVGRLSDGKIRKPLAFYRLLEFIGKFKKHFCSKKKLDPSEWTDMPLRIEAFPSDNVYFVPIDFVQSAITKLFPLPVENRTYHITGNSPVSTKDIEMAVGNTLKVHGVTVVEKIANATLDEKLMMHFIGDLLPYFSSEAIFDVSNVVEALGKDALDWEITLETLCLLMTTFFKQKFPNVPWIQQLNYS